MTKYAVTIMDDINTILEEIYISPDVTMVDTLEEAKKLKADLENEMLDDDWEDYYIYKIEVTKIDD